MAKLHKTQQIEFRAPLEKFGRKGEKSGWTCFTIDAAYAAKLNPDDRKSFRVKGSIDGLAIEMISLLPMGNGDYIMPLNMAMRRQLGKRAGDEIFVLLQADPRTPEMNSDLMECLAQDALAQERFNALTAGHQRYFSKWIESAKTTETKARRIAHTLFAMQHQMDYGATIRHFKGKDRG